jgi:hypothetical protein
MFRLQVTIIRQTFQSEIPLTVYAGIKSFRATLSAEIFLLGILIFKGLTVRRLYKSL